MTVDSSLQYVGNHGEIIIFWKAILFSSEIHARYCRNNALTNKQYASTRQSTRLDSTPWHPSSWADRVSGYVWRQHPMAPVVVSFRLCVTWKNQSLRRKLKASQNLSRELAAVRRQKNERSKEPRRWWRWWWQVEGERWKVAAVSAVFVLVAVAGARRDEYG